MNVIYTAGYVGWTPATLKAEAERLGAIILDIRHNPTSRRPEWRYDALRVTFDDRYRHVPELGNRNYRGGSINLAAPAQAIPIVRRYLARQPVILLCACRNWRDCHRRDAADYLAQMLDAPVEHLEAPRGPVGIIKALTVRQPWAWALFHGKDIENRNWATRYRGPLAIHAAKAMTRGEYEGAVRFCAARGVIVPTQEALVFGAVIGTVEVVACVRDSTSAWFEGPYGLVMQAPTPCSPVRAAGALGLWDWRGETDVSLFGH